jgi:hypothetical protein
MRVILEGSLHHFSINELLHLLGDRAHTGTFNAESSEGQARLAFRDGKVVWAEAAKAPTPGDVVAQLLDWSDGTFTFLDAVAMPEGATPLALDVASLMADAMARLAEKKRLLQLYPDDRIVLRVVNRPAVSGAINLSPEEFQILFQFAGGRSLAQVLHDTKRPATELYPLVRALQNNGLLEPAGPDPEATLRTPPEEVKTLVEPRAAPPSEPKIKPPEPKPKARPSVETRKPPVEAKGKPSVETKAPPPSGARIVPPVQPRVEAKVAPPVEQKAAPPASKVAPPAATPEATQVEKKPVLIGTLTSDDGTMHPLIEDVTTIGRVGSNDIMLDDGSISTKHARVHRAAEGFVIEDLRSRNGTFVNSDKVTDKRLLVDGDLVRLGKVILTFNLAVEMRSGSSTQELIPKG